MEREWLTLKEQLSTIRHYIAEAYFLIPIENSLPISTEHAIFQVFDGIDKVIKIADSYILSTKDYNEKYCYGGTSDGLDDHTSQWGGAGPDCMPVPG